MKTRSSPWRRRRTYCAPRSARRAAFPSSAAPASAAPASAGSKAGSSTPTLSRTPKPTTCRKQTSPPAIAWPARRSSAATSAFRGSRLRCGRLRCRVPARPARPALHQVNKQRIDSLRILVHLARERAGLVVVSEERKVGHALREEHAVQVIAFVL